MVLRTTLLASILDSEKSVKNLVNDTNLRLAGLLLPHQSIGEEGANKVTATPEEARFEEPIFEEPEYADQMVDGPLDPPLFTAILHIHEPAEVPAHRNVVEGDARANKKEKATEPLEVESSDEDCINYSTLLDTLSIPEDLFSGINSFNLASSVADISRDSLYNFDWDSLDAGSVSYLFASFCLWILTLIFIDLKRCLPLMTCTKELLVVNERQKLSGRHHSQPPRKQR